LIVTNGGGDENVIGVIDIYKIILYCYTYSKLVSELLLLRALFPLTHKQLPSPCHWSH